MNCCKLEQAGTQEYGKVTKRIQVLEDGRVLAKEARNRKIEGQKRRIAENDYQRLLHEFEMEGLWRIKGIVEPRWREGAAGQRSFDKGKM